MKRVLLEGSRIVPHLYLHLASEASATVLKIISHKMRVLDPCSSDALGKSWRLWPMRTSWLLLDFSHCIDRWLQSSQVSSVVSLEQTLGRCCLRASESLSP